MISTTFPLAREDISLLCRGWASVFIVSPPGIHISLGICVWGYTYHGDTHITVTPGLSRNGPLAVTLIGCRKRRKLKALYPRGWIQEWSAVRGGKDPFCCLFLLFYGLMVGKYALICTMEIQKIHMVVRIFSGFALFTELMWVYRGVESLCKLLTANKVPFDLPTNECKSKYCPS